MIFCYSKTLFVSEIIEERKPLTKSARRAGWVGSNILFSKIPKAGQIFYVENGKELAKKMCWKNGKKPYFERN